MRKALMIAMASLGISGIAAAAPLDDYTLNFSAAGDTLGATIADINHVDEWQFLANSIVAFDDKDGSLGISAGDTFYDWVAVRVTGFTDALDNNKTPALYGSGDPLVLPGVGTFPRTHEITLLARFGGTQTSENTYRVDFIDQFDFFFDAGAAFSMSNFTDIATFGDGQRVETADLIASAGVNTDPLQITGTLSMVLSLNDILHTVAGANDEFFEVDGNGNPFPMELVLGIVDANNNLQDVDETAFAEYFGADLNSDGTTTVNELINGYDFYFESKNDGSFNKEIVPEPGTMVLLGSGLMGLAGAVRRRKKA